MEFLSNLPTILTNWPWGTITALIIYGLILILFIIVICLLFIAADSWFLPRERRIAKVIKKEYSPAFRSSVFIDGIQYEENHPAEWTITVEVDGKQGSKSVDNNTFCCLQLYGEAMTEFVTGRFSSNLYFKKIYYA